MLLNAELFKKINESSAGSLNFFFSKSQIKKINALGFIQALL